MKRGLFIVFEAVDGAGKTTIIEKLKNDYPEFVYTNEPGGGTEVGKEIRRLIKDPNIEINTKAQILLVYANREMNLKEVILPNIEKGKVVVSDRFTDSTYAYQVITEKHNHSNLNLINYLERNIVGLNKPDLVFVLDVSYEESLRRRGLDTSRGEDRFDNTSKEVFEKRREYYRNRAENTSDYYLIDTMRDLEEVYKDVKSIVDIYLDAF